MRMADRTLRDLAVRITRPARLALSRVTFPGSEDYWERRYARGGDSGAGSYGDLARFKAQVLNEFVNLHDVGSVIEFGCGDGHQLGLATYPSYIGLDVAPSAITLCRKNFEDDPTKSFYLYSTPHFLDHERLFRADLAISLDVLFHLIEDDIFEGYLRHLFSAADRFVIVYSSDEEVPTKSGHVRHRNFSRWVAANIDDFRFVERISNPLAGIEMSESHFYVFERTSEA